jgi:ABC-type uncharacterized transport system permease subunit
MFENSFLWLRVASIFYSIGLVGVAIQSMRGFAAMERYSFPVTAVGLVFHLVSIVERAAQINAMPVQNFWQSISLAGFLLGVLYVFIRFRYRFASLSTVFQPLILSMALAASLEKGATQQERGFWLIVHVILMLAGYASLLVTAVTSLLYLAQERSLKLKKALPVGRALPPLGVLDTLISRSMGLGFALFSAGVLIGVMWAFRLSGQSWLQEPPVLIALITWMGFLIMVYLRSQHGWRGRRTALMALGVLAFAVLTWATHAGLQQTITGKVP